MFAGYGPLLALAVAFMLVVTLVPSIDREHLLVPSGQAVDATAPPATRGGTPAPPTVAPTRTARERVAAAGAAGAVAVPGGGIAGTLPASPGRAAARGGACSDRKVQVLGDTYSPPCVAWPAGKDNGGATSRGVTRDTITIGFRMPVENISDLQGAMAQLAGDKGDQVPVPTEEDLRRTTRALITYFERNFQFYGRRLKLIEWEGKGSALNELLGAGQEAATADAIRAAKELKVFADVSGFTAPYNDALARQKVVAIGAPYMPARWFRQRAPYSWSPFPDCTTLAHTLAEYTNKRIFGYAADHAGGSLQGKPRKVAVVAPDNPEYQECADEGVKLVEAAGNDVTRYSYTLDMAALSDQANNMAAKIKHDEISTVVLATDPLLPLLLASRLSQQDYYPEWVVTGTALTDSDVIGQLYDQEQWQHAFGLSLLGEQQPQRASYAYAAVKSVDPKHEPTIGAELLYYFLYILAIGVQLAGPDLTPDTFASGMRAYPGGTGPAGTWGFPDGEYSPYRDAREIWWDPNATSVVNSAAGRFVSTNDRHRAGKWPAGPAAPEQLKPGHDPARTREDQ